MASWQPHPQRLKRSQEAQYDRAEEGQRYIDQLFRRSSEAYEGVEGSRFFVERRRTPHPHNPPFSRFSSVSSSSRHNHNNNMDSERGQASQSSQPSQPPRLVHRATQTFIDLTDDGDENEAEIIANNLQRAPTIPSLRRTDGDSIADIIDLTNASDDVDDDLQITGAREIPHEDRQRSQSQAQLRPLRDLPRPHQNQPLGHPIVDQYHPDYLLHDLDQPEGGVHPVAFVSQNDFRDHFRDNVRDLENQLLANQNGLRDLQNRLIGIRSPLERMRNFHRELLRSNPVFGDRAPPQMPAVLDYVQQAFPRSMAVPPPKPEHKAPPAAQDGFTRSPTEDDIIICPCCEEELVAKKGEDDQPLIKKGNRPPSRKDREEHAFWVIRDCGHVYCNRCFQHRKPDKKNPSGPEFPEIMKEGSKSRSKIPVCAVAGCGGEILARDKWIGVFM